MARFAKEADRPGMPMPTALAADRKPKDLTNRLQRISGSSQAAQASSIAHAYSEASTAQAATHKGTAKVKAKKKVHSVRKISRPLEILTGESGRQDAEGIDYDLLVRLGHCSDAIFLATCNHQLA